MPAPSLPVDALDLPSREGLIDALRRLAAERPSPATVTVTHHLEELPPATGHALLLREGRTAACGPAPEVLTGGVLTQCFGRPVEVSRRDGRWPGPRARPSQPGTRPRRWRRSRAGGAGPGQHPAGPAAGLRPAAAHGDEHAIRFADTALEVAASAEGGDRLSMAAAPRATELIPPGN